MLKSDPFQVLGLQRNASVDDIKKAYKALAKKYHPDISKEPNASEIFNEISEAYTVALEQKKDTGSYRKYKTTINIDDIFGDSFRGNIRTSNKTTITLSVLDAQNGCKQAVTINDKIHLITIPPGMIHGSKLNFYVDNVKLAVDINIKMDKSYTTEGVHLIKMVRLSTSDFDQLNTMEVENHVGKKFSIGLKSGTDTLTTLRVPKAGLYCSQTNKQGDLLVKLTVFKK